jgi:hypothetical protein
MSSTESTIENVSIKSKDYGHEATTVVNGTTVIMKFDHLYKPLSIHINGSASEVLHESTVGCACERFSEVLEAADAYTTENIVILQNLCNCQ